MSNYSRFAMTVLCLGATRACEQAEAQGFTGRQMAMWLAKLCPTGQAVYIKEA